MSAHAGTYIWHGREADVSDIECCVPHLDRLGPQGGDVYVMGPVCMIYRAFHVTPESLSEKQPVIGRDTSVLMWDGRLDNREDLSLLLGERGTDAAIVSAAWIKWGIHACGRLLGDWALAHWSAATHTVTLARDFAGTCPIYYLKSTAYVMWCSELEGVVDFARSRGIDLTVDEEWVAGHFGLGEDPECTPYREIRAVDPGGALRITRAETSNHCHTKLEPNNQIRYGRDGEYEEHFRELFLKSVSCRLRTFGKVWAHLSGGLDSSSVVAAAAHITRENGRISELETVSAVYDESAESNENRFIAAIEERYGLVSHHFSERDYPLLTPVDLGYQPASPLYMDVFIHRELAIADQMMQCGARVQIGGDGGDEMLGNIADGVPHLLDLLHFGSWKCFGNELLRWSLASRRPVWSVAGDLICSIAPTPVAGALDNSETTNQVEYLLDKRFLKRTSFRCRMNERASWDRLALPSQRTRFEAVTNVIRRHSRAPFRRLTPISVVTPMLDLRLIRFLLSIPIDQLSRPGQPRSLQRRALEMILPSSLLSRRTKCSPDAAVYRALRAHWSDIEDLVGSLVTDERRIIDHTRLFDTAQKVRDGHFPVTIFLKTLLFEKWLRTLSGHASVAPEHILIPARTVGFQITQERR